MIVTKMLMSADEKCTILILECSGIFHPAFLISPPEVSANQFCQALLRANLSLAIIFYFQLIAQFW